MATRKTYKLEIHWQDKKRGPQVEKVTAEGTSIRRAIANGLLGFFSKGKPQSSAVRDAHASLTVSAERKKKKPAR